jgi:hypothetical protein
MSTLGHAAKSLWAGHFNDLSGSLEVDYDRYDTAPVVVNKGLSGNSEKLG